MSASQHRAVNAETLARIKQWEGLRLRAYQCDADVWTIGYGHTAGVAPGDAISEEQAEQLLRADLRTAEAAVARLVRVELTGGQFGALVSLVFNIGPGAFARSTLLRKLNAGDYTGARDQFAVWRISKGRVSDGLVARRQQEVALWNSGEFVASNYVAAAPAPAPVSTPVSATAGAAGGVLVSGAAAAVIAEHASAAATVIGALRDVPASVGVALIVAVMLAGLLIWKPWRRG